MLVSQSKHAPRRFKPDTPLQDHHVGSAKVVGLIRRLCEALKRRSISYVHWKSNINREQALAGVDDLDLLVSRQDACAFLEVLFQLGFREVVDGASKTIPGIHHFYGLDERTGEFVHVHAHFQLVLGHDATKNFHLPLEAAVLASANGDALLPVPAPEFELILYTIRMVLKFDTVRNPFSKIDRAGYHREFEYLKKLSDLRRVDRLMNNHLPCCGGGLFEACMAVMQPGVSNLARRNAQQRLHVALRAHARRPRWLDACLKHRRFWATTLRVALGLPKRRKRLAQGGVVIAIVGGDGAGKTSVVRHLAKRYSSFLATQTFHLGKPRRAMVSRVVRTLHQVNNGVWRRLGLMPSASKPRQPTPSGLLMTLKHCCTGRDRYRNYRRACQFATKGGVAICDRWPIPGLRLMDSPKPFEPTGSPLIDRIVRLLRSKESRYHERILRPDSLFVLRLHPDVAVARRTDEGEAHVRPRSQEVWEFDWQPFNAHVIDASKPFPDVVSEILRVSWKEL